MTWGYGNATLASIEIFDAVLRSYLEITLSLPRVNLPIFDRPGRSLGDYVWKVFTDQ
jgi:hypothetical protein